MRRPLVTRLLGLTVARRYRDEVIDDLVAQHEAERARSLGRLRAGGRLHARLLRSGWDSRVHSRRAAADAPRRHQGVRDMPGSVLRDVRLAARALARTPWFSAAAVGTLSLGLGGALTMAAVANGILRAPVPWSDPDRLVMLSSNASALWGVTFQEHEEVARSSTSLQQMAAWQGWGATLTDPSGLAARVSAASVGGEFFRLLGVTPALGRAIEPADDQTGRPPVVVLQHAAWQRFFGGDPGVIGRRLDIDGTPYTIVGVMPDGFIDPVNWAIFGGSTPVSVWRSAPDLFQRGRDTIGWVGFWSIGRLTPGAALSTAAAEVQAARSRLAPDAPSAVQTPEPVVTLRTANTRAVRSTVYTLLAAVAALLLIVCANVANLMLSRALGRRGEVALRLALGAPRAAVIRQVLAESAVLAALGAAAGLLIASAGVRAVRLAAGPHGLAGRQFEVDGQVVLAGLGLAAATAFLFGIVPAWRASRGHSVDALRESGRGQDTSRAGRHLRRVLVVVETAVACALLMQAGLLGRSLVNLLQADPGFETRETMAIGLSLPQATFDRVIEQAAVLDAVFAEISRVPGVVAVGSISDFPMSGAINSTITPVVGVADSKPRVLVRAIDGDYFGAMRIPVLRGRPFSAADRTGGAPVAMVNEAFARSQFADQDPIGRHVLVRGITREIVGVVRSVKEFRPTGGGDLTLYTPFRQEAENWMRTGVTVVVRADGPGLTVAGGVRQATARAAPGRPAGAPRAVTDYVERHLAVPRLQAIVIGTFAMTAIVLAAIGLGGVLACAVAERWREMAVRMSMGARPADIARLIVGQSMWLTAIGLALGVVAGSMLSGLVAGSLHGVETGDVPVTLAAVGVLFGAALVASWVPARRASRVNPIEALRG